MIEPFVNNIRKAWIPPIPAKSVEWIPENIIIPHETETPGVFDLDLFPHVRGVLEAADDPMVRNIFLIWAARNAKTTTALALLSFWACTAPRPSLFTSSNEDRADDTIQNQLYPMLEACKATNEKLLPEHRRSKKYVSLKESRIRKAFSGSPSTLAGFPACYAHASEVSKWTTVKSKEAGAVHLHRQRGKLYPFDSKYIFESTPGKKGECQITELANAPGVDKKRFKVPCPHCNTYQILEFGNGDEDSHGVKWEKGIDGRSDPQIAEDTAWYQCTKGCRIDNCDRASMMRKGLWVSESQTVTKTGKIRGKSPAASSIAFDELPSLYSLVVSGWGQIAREFLESKSNPEALRNFHNSTLAKVWDPQPRNADPHSLAERICKGGQRGMIPDFGRFLTIGIDVQEGADRFVWHVSAWGIGGQGGEVEHGESFSFDDIENNILNKQWHHEDGGEPLYVSLGLIDSGDEAETVYRLARSSRCLLPCKGMNHAFNMEYRDKILKPEQRRNISAVGDVRLIEINTDMTNHWVEKQLRGFHKSHDAPYFMAQESAFDVDFLGQLLNEHKVQKVNSKGHPVISWVRSSNGPNDYRDAWRYSKVAASVLTKNGKNWDQLPVRMKPEEIQTRRKRQIQQEELAARNDMGISAR